MEFDALDTELADLLAGFEPGSRRKLAGAIGKDVQQANAARMRANVTPDGAPMVPRKPRKERDPKAAAMFQRAAGGQWLRSQVEDDTVAVGFVGAMARLMGVHHYGLRDRVSREPGAPEVTYDARAVIGLPADDRIRMLDKVFEAIGS